MADGFSGYVRLETSAMRSFQATESERLGYRVTNNEAAVRWIKLGLAAKFRKDYKER